MFRGNQGNDQGDVGFDFYSLKEQLESAIDVTQNQLQALQNAYDALDQAEIGGDDDSSFQGRNRDNQGDRERNIPGRRNFANSNDETDGRTVAGRMQEADDYSDNDLMEFFNNAPRAEDGSIDLRTKEGRALEAAGWVDEQGFEIAQNIPGNPTRTRAHSHMTAR